MYHKHAAIYFKIIIIISRLAGCALKKQNKHKANRSFCDVCFLWQNSPNGETFFYQIHTHTDDDYIAINALHVWEEIAFGVKVGLFTTCTWIRRGERAIARKGEKKLLCVIGAEKTNFCFYCQLYFLSFIYGNIIFFFAEFIASLSWLAEAVKFPRFFSVLTYYTTELAIATTKHSPYNEIIPANKKEASRIQKCSQKLAYQFNSQWSVFFTFLRGLSNIFGVINDNNQRLADQKDHFYFSTLIFLGDLAITFNKFNKRKPKCMRCILHRLDFQAKTRVVSTTRNRLLCLSVSFVVLDEMSLN